MEKGKVGGKIKSLRVDDRKRSDRKEEKGIKTIKREKSGVEKNKIMDRKKEGEQDKEAEPHL
jgi:hypothetical protein